MKKIMAVLMVLTVYGCATTSGVVPYGKDTYMVSRTDNSFTASVSVLKGEALRDASEFCAKKGKAYEVVGGYDVPRSLGKIPMSEIQFICVAK